MAPSVPSLGLKDTASRTSGSKNPKSPKTPSPGILKRRLKDDELEPDDLAKRIRGREQSSARKARMLEARSRPRLIVGVDFGTTYSGVAYVSSTDSEKGVEVLTEWSGGARQTDILEKTPTRIAYSAENGDLEKDDWGYTPPGLKTYGWFKLLLDGNARPEQLDDPLLRQCAGQGLLQLPKNKLAKQVTKDYLRLLYEHFMDCMSTRIGELTLSQTPISFHFTVPAVWSHSARDATRSAATEAGFGGRPEDEFAMVDEPEAAAFVALNAGQVNDHGLAGLGSGSCVTVLDMGGGTVDIVSYRVAKMNPLQLEEACTGSGAKCGGTTIDRALHKLLHQWFGEAFSELPQYRVGLGSKFMADFEAIKRDFQAVRPNETFQLHLKLRGPLPPEAAGHYDMDEDEILLSGEDLAAMFDEVLTRSDQLVLSQYNDVKKQKKSMQVKHLILVGGASSPPYVLQHYRQFCRETLKGKVEVIRPQRAWSAICRGACLRGLEAAPILHRLSRYHYGVKCHKKFERGIHREADAFICPKNGKRAAGQMAWPIAKNEKLKPGEKKTIRCSYLIPGGTEADEYIFRETLYYSTVDEAPSHAAHDSVQEVGIMTVDLTNVIERRRREFSDDEEDGVDEAQVSSGMEIEVDISMTMGSDQGVLLVAAKVGSTKVGIAEIQYESLPSRKE